jgi:tetrathionate reductase subunit B
MTTGKGGWNMASKKYVMLVDSDRCVNCKACVTSCRAEWDTPLGESRNWVSEVMQIDSQGTPKISFLSGRCQHCDDPPCVPACPTGASYKREDGLVLVDRELCTGCEFCVDVCPYDARFRDPTDGMISKCTFCQPRIDAGQEPACVDVCFTRALTFGDANDPNSQVSQLLKQGGWKSLTTAEVDIGPNLYYSENTIVDETVLPKVKKPTQAAQVLQHGVNPGLKIGIGGMVGLFGAAGIVKLIRRKEEVARHE